MRKHAITVGVIAAMLVVLLGTGVGQVVFAVLVFAAHFTGYALWEAEAPGWWSFVFFFAILMVAFIGLRGWAMRRYLHF